MSSYLTRSVVGDCNDRLTSLHLFVNNVKKNYLNQHECATVDEQLVGFRERCKFRQNMPSKQGKCIIHFCLYVSSDTCLENSALIGKTF